MYVQPENFVFVLSVGIKRVNYICAAREFSLCIKCRHKEGCLCMYSSRIFSLHQVSI